MKKKNIDLFKEEKKVKGKYKIGDVVEFMIPRLGIRTGVVVDLDDGPVQVLRIKADSGYHSKIVDPREGLLGELS